MKDKHNQAAGETPPQQGVTRRRFIKATGAAGLAASVAPFIIVRPARAARLRMKSVAVPRAKKSTGSHKDTSPTTAK